MCCGVVALLVLALPVVAEEVLGVLSNVDLDTKTVTVVGSDEKEVEIKVTDETEYVTPKRTGKIDLERVAKGVARAQEKGRKGIGVTVTHEDGVASKIEVKARGKRRTAAERAR
jgi:hypothetical protein